MKCSRWPLYLLQWTFVIAILLFYCYIFKWTKHIVTLIIYKRKCRYVIIINSAHLTGSLMILYWNSMGQLLVKRGWLGWKHSGLWVVGMSRTISQTAVKDGQEGGLTLQALHHVYTHMPTYTHMHTYLLHWFML